MRSSVISTRWFTDRSVRVRVLSLVVTASAVLAFFGVMSVRDLQDTGRQSKLLVADNEATRAALLADMMHDGIRGDVVLSVMFATDESRYEDATAALADHTASIHEQLAKVADAGLGPEVAAAVERVAPAAQAYTDAATKEAQLAGTDAGAARAAYPEFEAAFEELEQSLPQVGDAISAHAQQTEARISDQRSSAVRNLVLVTLGSVLLLLVLGLGVVGSVVRPLRKVRTVLEGIADGDLTGRADVSSRDELGAMARMLDRATERLREVVGAVGENAAALASASEELSSVSGQMSGSAQESASQAGLVSAAADQVSLNVQTVATGTEQMSASIREIARSAGDAAGVAARAVGVAEATNTTVEKLGESSSEVGNVIKVINSIAQQTNLLALNATIEAARAGEAGRGFAVVANEVKELALETSKATEDIGRRIDAIQSDTDAAVAAIAEISGIIAQINDTQSTIASAVEEQTATTNEMSRNVGEAAAGSTGIAENITLVARSADDTRTAAGSTSQAAEDLARMAGNMQELVGQFRC